MSEKDEAIRELAAMASSLVDGLEDGAWVPGSIRAALRHKIAYYAAVADAAEPAAAAAAAAAPDAAEVG